MLEAKHADAQGRKTSSASDLRLTLSIPEGGAEVLQVRAPLWMPANGINIRRFRY